MARPRLITLEYLENLVKIQEEKETKERAIKSKTCVARYVDPRP